MFTGYVSKPYNGGGFTDEVTLKDEMLLLEETQINDTFLDTTPQEMISYFLGKAGVSKMKLSSPGLPETKAAPHSADERHRGDQCRACRMEHEAALFLFRRRLLLGGEAGAKQDLYVRVRREHHLSGEDWRGLGARDSVRPVCAPLPQDQRHSPESERGVEVSKVVSSTGENGFIRTKFISKKGGAGHAREDDAGGSRKIIAQEYPHAKSPSVVYATVSTATQLAETFELNNLVIYNEAKGEVFPGRITAFWNEYTLVVVDRWGNRDESFPALPGVRSKAQYKVGAVVAVAMAYGDSPAIIGEVQL